MRGILRSADREPLPPRHIQHSPGTPTTGLRERGNDTSKSTGRSGRQNAATQRNMRREERVTVQGPVKEQQPDGMSHRRAFEPPKGGAPGGGGGLSPDRSRQPEIPFGCRYVRRGGRLSEKAAPTTSPARTPFVCLPQPIWGTRDSW